MLTDPILAARSLPAGSDGYRVPLTFRVEGGLHFIRGNHAPYFALTYTQHRKGFPNQCYSGGAGHDRILALYPRFADLAALHLSDIDGVPTHAEANGWYWLAGAMGGAGERFHGGNASYPKEPPLVIFARHCGVTLAAAAAIRGKVLLAASGHAEADWTAGRARWGIIMAAMRPRWKAEADACIARHSLRVYGDPWRPESGIPVHAEPGSLAGRIVDAL
jgi:hypothetical protein